LEALGGRDPPYAARRIYLLFLLYRYAHPPGKRQPPPRWPQTGSMLGATAEAHGQPRAPGPKPLERAWSGSGGRGSRGYRQHPPGSECRYPGQVARHSGADHCPDPGISGHVAARVCHGFRLHPEGAQRSGCRKHSSGPISWTSRGSSAFPPWCALCPSSVRLWFLITPLCCSSWDCSSTSGAETPKSNAWQGGKLFGSVYLVPDPHVLLVCLNGRGLRWKPLLFS
jgi:hypothetical protein